MLKKIGKFLLVISAIAAVGAGVYYFLQNKEKFKCSSKDDEDDDFDNFDEDLDEPEAEPERSYVSLNHDAESEENSFEKLSSLVSDAKDTAGEKVEEFFNDEKQADS